MTSTSPKTTLVMGGSGFLGSHVIRALVARGDNVRVWVRPTSSRVAFDGLPKDRVEIVRGELDDPVALRGAMAGIDALHYCIVDTRAWLRDPAPLFRTNVEMLGNVIDAALETAVPRFVFCSTVGTIGIAERGLADEDTPHTWGHLGGPYIEARMQAEQAVLTACHDRGLPAVVLNVGTTYGANDFGPTPHGKLLGAAARGKMPAYAAGASMEIVGIEDAAAAFVLAEEKGRIGERYIISERFVPIRELFEIAAAETGVAAPKVGIPIPVLKVFGVVGDIVGKLRQEDSVVTLTSVRLMHIQSPLDHTKATRELGWDPRPTEVSIREGARFFVEQRAKARAERAAS